MLTAVLLAAALTAGPQPIRGDFDHDGRPDEARIMPAAGGGYQLIVKRGAVGAPEQTVARFAAGDMANLYLATAKAGHLATWCGKGGGRDSDPCPRKAVDLKGGELTYGAEEASETVVLWSGQRFEPVQISD